MIPAPFEYHRPTSVDEAVGLLVQHGDDCRPIAGGHSLIPMMKLRLAIPQHLVDLQSVADLKGISEDGNAIRIGAMTTQQELIASGLLGEKCPIIRETSELIADPQVRYLATLGGNVANGDPGNDMPALMQCLGAEFALRGPDGARSVAARDYYNGPYDTACQDNELLTEIRIPTPPAGHGWAYEKLKRKVGDYATAAAAIVLFMDDGRCAGASVALTNLGDTPLYAADAGAVLVGTAVDAAAIDKAATAAMGITNPGSDLRGPAEYRIQMAGVVVRRAIARALARVGG